jgi:hypothetical protein
VWVWVWVWVGLQERMVERLRVALLVVFDAAVRCLTSLPMQMLLVGW